MIHLSRLWVFSKSYFRSIKMSIAAYIMTNTTYRCRMICIPNVIRAYIIAIAVSWYIPSLYHFVFMIMYTILMGFRWINYQLLTHTLNRLYRFDWQNTHNICERALTVLLIGHIYIIIVWIVRFRGFKWRYITHFFHSKNWRVVK